MVREQYHRPLDRLMASGLSESAARLMIAGALVACLVAAMAFNHWVLRRAISKADRVDDRGAAAGDPEVQRFVIPGSGADDIVFPLGYCSDAYLLPKPQMPKYRRMGDRRGKFGPRVTFDRTERAADKATVRKYVIIGSVVLVAVPILTQVIGLAPCLALLYGTAFLLWRLFSKRCGASARQLFRDVFAARPHALPRARQWQALASTFDPMFQSRPAPALLRAVITWSWRRAGQS